jgi:hypothetical protein
MLRKRYASRSDVGPSHLGPNSSRPLRNLIGDKAYNSDKLDQELSSYGIELIAPHRSNRKKQNTRSASVATVPSTLEG